MATTLRLDPSIDARYSKLARETGRTKSYYLNKVLSGAIDRLEYEEQLLKDVQEIRAGKQRTYTLEEVKAELGLGS